MLCGHIYGKCYDIGISSLGVNTLTTQTFTSRKYGATTILADDPIFRKVRGQVRKFQLRKRRRKLAVLTGQCYSGDVQNNCRTISRQLQRR